MEAMNLDVPDTGALTQRHPDSYWDWANRGKSHVEFRKDEPLPFQEERELGHGVNGPVLEVNIKGFRVALKKIYCRQGVTQKNLQEIKILKRLKHPHIIEVVGSYTRGKYLGILLHPVATCDLSTFLEDIDYLERFSRSLSSGHPTNLEFEEEGERTRRCATVCGFGYLNHVTRYIYPNNVVEIAKAKLWRSYRCIASAIQHLHENSIRHKDIKPHNILLSPEGLWVTDFGLSTDFSGISTSNTSGGERGTVKYCAPEIAAFQRSGRSADIYSLGCLFFEMAAINSYTLAEMKEFRPLMDGSYHNNRKGISSAFVNFGDGTNLGHLPMGLARTMMATNPRERPDAATVLQNLDFIQVFSGIEPRTFPTVSCCLHVPPVIPASPVSTTIDLSITIGNTCQNQNIELTSIDGRDAMKTPMVVFVDCSYEGLIDRVIFFQVSSPKFHDDI
ncbi:kinase-like domain-containing protein [Phaeosphaeria sp. MPI-PUGE-AT-0046c]|nr:kinase-like domain-containing protein [Phaeosphaeria sp. MPI-PUGE-AT-0046c]